MCYHPKFVVLFLIRAGEAEINKTVYKKSIICFDKVFLTTNFGYFQDKVLPKTNHDR